MKLSLSYIMSVITQYGYTALMRASRNGMTEVVAQLVKAGSALDLQNKVCISVHRLNLVHHVRVCVCVCVLLSNDEIRARVIDTPGFADSKVTKDEGVYGGNLNIVRSILMYNEKYKLKIRRILYFLPTRGPLTRAGGVLQEEIKVLYGFFGESIFNVMVIIATYDKEDSDSLSFSPNKIDKTTNAFMAAYTVITGKVLPKCPPILYLPASESGTLSRVKSAEVIDDEPLD